MHLPKSLQPNHLVLFVALILISALSACEGGSASETVGEDTIEATEPLVSHEDLQKEAFEKFATSPAEAVPIFKALASQLEQTGKQEELAMTMLNLSNIYDEYLGYPDSALMAAQKSLEIWQNLGDSMQVANLHKYKGFLLSQVSLTDQALVEIDRAMELYTLLDYKPGMAVTEFNLAQVYFDGGQTEKSVSYFEKSMKYWRTEGDQKRIFINNIFGIDLYRKAGKDKQAKALIAENEGLISSLAVPQFVIDEFNAVKNGQN